jgi:broad specificity phosphatase PhoE
LADLKKEHRSLRRRPLFTPVFLAGLASALALAVAAWVIWHAGAVTVVLVRHAETVAAGENPGLSAAGQERARRLASALEFTGLDAIYTSELLRTVETAAPVAARTGVEPAVVPAADLGELVRTLTREHRGDTVLVVGHSNTLPLLTGALGEPIADIAEADYGNIYIVRSGPFAPSWMIRLRY